MLLFPDHRSRLCIEFCSSNPSFSGLGNTRPSKHCAITLLPLPSLHPLVSSFAGKYSFSSLQGPWVFKLLLTPPCQSGVGRQPIFWDRQEAALLFYYSKASFHLDFSKAQAASPALISCTETMNSFRSSSAQPSRSQPFQRRMSKPLVKRWSLKNEMNTCLWWFSTFKTSFTPEFPGVKTLSLLNWYWKLQVPLWMCCQCLQVNQPSVTLLAGREGEDPYNHLFLFLYLLKGTLRLSVWGVTCLIPSDSPCYSWAGYQAFIHNCFLTRPS